MGRRKLRRGGENPFAFWWGVDLVGLAEAYAGPYFPPAASESPLVRTHDAAWSYHFWHGGTRKKGGRGRRDCRGRVVFLALCVLGDERCKASLVCSAFLPGCTPFTHTHTWLLYDLILNPFTLSLMHPFLSNRVDCIKEAICNSVFH